MPPQPLALLRTPAPFQAWLARTAPTKRVGWRRNPQGCPLTLFLSEEGYDVLGVNMESYVLGTHPEAWVTYALPSWAQRFVARVDATDGAGELPMQIRAAEALAALTEDLSEEPPC